MIKKIMNFSGSKLLSSTDQLFILGGKRPSKGCDLDGSCEIGFCCKGGVCIDDTPGSDGTIPACDAQ